MPPTVVVPGATIGYDVAGPEGAPAVLFIHAGVATRAMWDPQFSDLAADHRVIRYDTSGYGDSPGDAVVEETTWGKLLIREGYKVLGPQDL